MTKTTSGSAKIKKAPKASKKSAAADSATVTETPVKTKAPKAPKATKKAASKMTSHLEFPAAVTTVVAKVDVGFGNSLFLRGTGPGLSWDCGVEMTNTGSDEWTWASNTVSEDFLAKVLINDVIWSGDPDTTVKAGEKTVITATF